jgi:hypothetical protein
VRQGRHDEGEDESGPESPGEIAAHGGRRMPEGESWGNRDVMEASGSRIKQLTAKLEPWGGLSV